MNKSRKISLLNMIVNLALIGLEVAGIYFLIQTMQGGATFAANYFSRYEVLTVIVTCLGAALMIWANIVSFIKNKDCTPRLFYTIRYLSAVMSLITFIVTVAFIVPQEGTKVIFWLNDGAVFMNFVCPLISILQFTCLEIEPKAKFVKTLEPFIGTVLYGVGIISAIFAVNATQGVAAAAKTAPYFFFLVTPELAAKGTEGTNYLTNIGILIGALIVSYVAAVILWLLNRMFHSAFIGEEYQPITPTAKKTSSKKKGEPAAKKGNAFTNFMKRKVAFGDGTSSSGPVYHISYHDRRLKTWKVKAENAGRALKVFPTQKEAIAFANSCIRKSGGSIRVHSMMGKMRKE